MHTRTESRYNNALETKRLHLAKSFSKVGNALHVILLIVPVALWCAWCVWCVVNLFAQGIRTGAHKLSGAGAK